MLYDGVYGPVEYGSLKETLCAEVFYRRQEALAAKAVLDLAMAAQNFKEIQPAMRSYVKKLMPNVNFEAPLAVDAKQAKAIIDKFMGKPIAFTATGNSLEEVENALKVRRSTGSKPENKARTAEMMAKSGTFMRNVDPLRKGR